MFPLFSLLRRHTGILFTASLVGLLPQLSSEPFGTTEIVYHDGTQSGLATIVLDLDLGNASVEEWKLDLKQYAFEQTFEVTVEAGGLTNPTQKKYAVALTFGALNVSFEESLQSKLGLRSGTVYAFGAESPYPSGSSGFDFTKQVNVSYPVNYRITGDNVDIEGTHLVENAPVNLHYQLNDMTGSFDETLIDIKDLPEKVRLFNLKAGAGRLTLQRSEMLTLEVEGEQLKINVSRIRKAQFPAEIDLHQLDSSEPNKWEISLLANPPEAGNTTGSGLYLPNSLVHISTTAVPGYIFGGWSGDLVSENPSDVFTATSDFSATANFTPDEADSDGDGLTNYEEIFVYQTRSDMADSDADQIPDGIEVSMGMNPRHDDSSTFQAIRQNPEILGLYSTQSVTYYLKSGSSWIQRDGDLNTINWNLLRSDDLEKWEIISTLQAVDEESGEESFYRISLP